jgi:hypothetical protein
MKKNKLNPSNICSKESRLSYQFQFRRFEGIDSIPKKYEKFGHDMKKEFVWSVTPPPR